MKINNIAEIKIKSVDFFKQKVNILEGKMVRSIGYNPDCIVEIVEAKIAWKHQKIS
ncbi:hypothetical protein NCR96_08930 [Helicobacter sp. 14348-15]|uniref:hypothetical protein n=1 Tax=Helicobacter TaxID=209 RepID=UPI001F56623A|nr:MULTISPECIES: hypothetical protein [Helicobacter]MCI2236833.1 hypothetical protein [Helicobacter sp. CaF467b]MCL9821856.1 hypothetical protein [Helicobacter colisuis]